MRMSLNDNAGTGTGETYHSQCAILRDQHSFWSYAERGGNKVSDPHGRVKELCSLVWEQCLSLMWKKRVVGE